eukprot:jgi/Phyca11/130666/e_gw1.96.61.1
MVNFIDHRTNYCRIFLAKTKDVAALKFKHFMAFFERQFNCCIHVLRTDGGGEYKPLDIFCEQTGIARQISEPRNQASNGKAERMHRTIMNMNGVWTVEVPPVGSHVLHTKWVFKTKIDADGAIERFKARLVACGNEQLYGIDYNLTFAAVIELSTVKVILVFARRWRVPVRHGDIPNAYVKAEKEQHLEIYLAIPKGMIVPEEVLRACGVSSYKKLALRLK